MVGPLAPVCEQMGVRYIDPRDEVGAVSMPWAACR